MAPGATVDAVLPAGGRIGDQFATEVGTDVKALIPLNSRSILERTLCALRETGRIARAVIVGPDAVQADGGAELADAVLPDMGGPAQNIFSGLEWLRESNAGRHAERVLVMTTDLPLVTPEGISSLFDACPPDADIGLPVIERREFRASFPTAPRKFARLRDGKWIIAGSAIINPVAVEQNRIHVERAYAARRNFARLPLLLGPMFLLRCALHRATLDDVVRRCEQILHCTCRAVRGCPPELGLDIDYYEDYLYAAERVT